jgi:hypothetical protein
LLQLAYSLSFPTCLSHPMKCSYSLINSPSASPLPFQGFNTRPDRKSHNLVTNSQHTREQFLANISLGENSQWRDNPLLQQQIYHLERMFMGLTTYLFDNKSLTYIILIGLKTHLFDNKTLVTRWVPLSKIFSVDKVMVIPPAQMVRPLKKMSEFPQNTLRFDHIFAWS